ncbi:MAG: tripartite tricarboxylate transporter substrate-binding protein [Pigmentiphaga sp.]
MPFNRRQVLQLTAGSAAALALPSIGRANEAPPLDVATIILGFAAGGTIDTLARRTGHELSGTYAHSVVVENRTGAGGQIAVQAVTRSKPDGATILCTPMSPIGIHPFTYKNLPYDPVKDLEAVSLGCIFDIGFGIGPAVPESVTNIQQFFDWVRQHPHQANFGSPGAGSTPHFIGDLIGRTNGVPLTNVAFRGSPPAIVDLIGGQIPAVAGPLGEFLPHLKDGRVRLIATSGAKRSKFTPEIPTLVEQGMEGLVFTEWFGFFVAAGTPKSIRDRLSADIAKALKQQEAINGLEMMGLEARSSTPEAFTALFAKDTARWKLIVEQVGFRADS